MDRAAVRLLLVLALLAAVFAMHGLSAHHGAELVPAHSGTGAARGVMAMTAAAPSAFAVGDDNGAAGGHQSQIGTPQCLAVLAAATALPLVGVPGSRPGGVLVAQRTASRQRLSRGPPRARARSLAQLCVLRT